MTKNTWITVLVVAIVFGGGGYYFGTQQASSATPAPSGANAYAGRTGAGGAGRFGGAAGGGLTTGTIISTGSGTMTIQLPSSTSTSATVGTKIVLFDTTTQVTEMKTVDASTLTVGQGVVVSGTTNSDGSLTATSIQVRPTRTGAPTGTAPATGQ